MRGALAILFATLIGSEPAVLSAQQSEPLPSVESLGVSFDRIKRQMGQQPASTTQTSLKLDYYVDVVGVAPPF